MDMQAVSPTPYDTLVHAVCESPEMAHGDVFGVVQGLFPAHRQDNDIYDSYVNELFLAQYTHYRTLGLSIPETAHQLGVSGILLAKMLEGDGVSLPVFVSLVQAEQYALANFKTHYLDTLFSCAEKAQWRAAVAALEKIDPAHYGVRTGVGNNDNDEAEPFDVITYRDDDYEDPALPEQPCNLNNDTDGEGE